MAKSEHILRGMKSIADFSGLSESSIIKFCIEYEDFPVRKNGNYYSHKLELEVWMREWSAGRK